MAQTTLFVDKKSFFHGLDPRSKLVWMLCVWICAVFFNHPFWNFGILFFVLLVAFASKILERLSFIAMGMTSLFFMAVLMWPFFIKGSTPLRQVGPLTIYYESVLYSISIGFRLVSMVLAGMILFTTTRIEDLAVSLRKIKIPYPMIFGITMVARFFPTMVSEAQLISSAAQARGVNLRKGNLIEKIKKRIAVMSPLLVTTLRRVNDLTKAIEARGFSPTTQHSFLYDQIMQQKDWFLVIASFFATIILLYCRIILGLGAVFPGRL